MTVIISKRGDADAHDLLLCIHPALRSLIQTRLRFATDQLYVKSSEEMAESFQYPKPSSHTKSIAEQCTLEIPLHRTQFPRYNVPPPHTSTVWLKPSLNKGCHAASPPLGSSRPTCMNAAWTNSSPSVSMGRRRYFLIVWDIMKFARPAHPSWLRARSAADSLVAYALGITSWTNLLDLLFEEVSIRIEFPRHRYGFFA